MTLRRIGFVVAIASVLVGQSAIAGAQERETTARTVTTTVPPASASAQPAMMMTVGGALADLFTTLSVINNGAGREANPLLGQSPARIIATKSLLLVPQLLAERHLTKHGHPKIAMWLGVALGGLGTTLAIHNMNVGH